jgi:hypothetical protein
MKMGKKIKPVLPIEYRLLISPFYKEREKQTVILIALRTISEFTNFKYEIVVQESIVDKTINLNISGLRAPQVSLPNIGPALFEKEYTSLKGTYNVHVAKLGREMNKFVVDISTKKVVVKQSPKNIFVEIVTNQQDF